jgi:hypothetical protein
VVGNQPDDGAELDKAPHPAVDRPVKGIGRRIARCMRMLHVVGERQIQQLSLVVLEQRDSGVEHKQRQIG